MCFHSKQTATAQELKNRFHAKFKNAGAYKASEAINGFTHPLTPVITNQATDEIELFEWGLIPSWAKDPSIQKNTLNAKIETLHEKAAFKQCIQQRCIVLANGFYEWKWLDGRGKHKEKYLITVGQDEIFAFAGIWNNWLNPQTGTIHNTYSILTTEANELMSEIHNSAKRMPVVLEIGNELDWLNGQGLKLTEQMKAISLEAPMQQRLF